MVTEATPRPEADGADEPDESATRPLPARLVDSIVWIVVAVLLFTCFEGLLRLNYVRDGQLRSFSADMLDQIPVKIATLAVGLIFLAGPAVLLLARLVMTWASAPIARIFAAIARHPRLTVATLATVALAAAAVVSLIALKHCVVTDDENIQLFQAHLLERGRLTAKIPTLHPFFEQPRLALLARQEWTGIFPWGHVALLALGDLAGLPQLWPHLTAPITVVLTYLLCREVQHDDNDRSIAVGAATFVATSPFLILTAATLHNATTSVVLVTLGAYLLARHRRRGGARWAALAGLAFGADLHARPLNALVMGGVALAVTAFAERRDDKPLRPLVAGFAQGVLPFVVLQGAIDWLLVGNPLLTPLFRGNEGPIFGFGNMAFGVYHTPMRALGQVGLSLMRLLLWASGSALTALGLLAAAAGARRRSTDWLWLLPVAALLLAYLFFFRSAPLETGPIYVLDALPFLAIFLANVVAGFPAALSRLRGRPLSRREGVRARQGALVAAAIAVATGFFTWWPAHVVSLSRISETVLGPYRAVESAGIHQAIVLWSAVPGQRSDVNHPTLPGPSFDDDVLFANDRRDNVELVRAYPDRKIYALRYEKNVPVIRPWLPPGQ